MLKRIIAHMWRGPEQAYDGTYTHAHGGATKRVPAVRVPSAGKTPDGGEYPAFADFPFGSDPAVMPADQAWQMMMTGPIKGNPWTQARELALHPTASGMGLYYGVTQPANNVPVLATKNWAPGNTEGGHLAGDTASENIHPNLLPGPWAWETYRGAAADNVVAQSWSDFGNSAEVSPYVLMPRVVD